MNGRKEKRISQRIEVLLSEGEQPLFSRASTENVSPNGMRVQTGHPWKPESRLRVKSTVDDLRATARVVYCELLAPNTFALGLELARARDAHIDSL
jgi:PilZ domain